MSLKSLMEDKQLDFNQPLLSVRRFTSAAASLEAEDRKRTDNSLPCIPPIPYYKSELKSGPVRNPGTVPFQWEQIPGRPKYESKPETQALGWPPVAPKLPPGQILNAKNQLLDKRSEDQTISRPQMENSLFSSQNVLNVQNDESFREAIDEESSESRDGDEAYLDALDTLSRTESCFMNCSASGLSGLDGPDVKPSGIFSTDPQTRDFMMGRFLPAAKAMASETPQYASRKQPVAREKPKQVMNVVSDDKRPSICHYRHGTSPYYAQHQGEEDSEDENDCDESEHLQAKACGLFSGFCLGNSFFLSNPVSGMRVQARTPTSSVHSAKARYSYGSCSRISKNEHGMVPNFERSMRGLRKTEQCKDRKALKNETNQILSHKRSHKSSSSSVNRHVMGDCRPPRLNESPQSIFHDVKWFLGIPGEAMNVRVNDYGSHEKGHRNFQDLIHNHTRNFQDLIHNHTQDADLVSTSPVVEKTLYIDSVCKVKSPSLNSKISDAKRLIEARGNDFQTLKSQVMEDTPSVDSLLQAIKCSDIMGEKATLQTRSFQSTDYSFLSSSEKSSQEVLGHIIKNFRPDEKLIKDSTTSATANVQDDVFEGFGDQQSPKAATPRISEGSYSQFPRTPPLPKSPSESWLGRTLPYISSRNPSSRSYLGIQNNPRGANNACTSNLKV
ncbi:uncharacterized protein LOC131149482 isoform X2 [Malania oleifera]|uniref:uncharacterized protein LOC131149482 isoform X2 n=1 Tax=Malania oleifera TaxID=397392 RepID=UPI0025AE9641|nr:uncharacterized protein LOC131149482 isoform X2 [Malania oleifera]